jgi:hypothetical protein
MVNASLKDYNRNRHKAYEIRDLFTKNEKYGHRRKPVAAQEKFGLNKPMISIIFSPS